MRVLGNSKEKICTCEKCKSRLAYTDKDVLYLGNDSYVDKASKFLKDCEEDHPEFKSQIRSRDFDLIKKYSKTWDISVEYKNFGVECPVCGEVIPLVSKLCWIELYAPGVKHDFREGEVIPGKYYLINNFLEREFKFEDIK